LPDSTLNESENVNEYGLSSSVQIGYIPTEIRYVALHEIESILVSNFFSQILIAIGSSLLVSSLIFKVDSLAIQSSWIGFVLLLSGIVMYAYKVSFRYIQLKKSAKMTTASTKMIHPIKNDDTALY